MFVFPNIRRALVIAALFCLPAAGSSRIAQADDIRTVNTAIDQLLFNAADGKLYGGGVSGANATSIVPIDPVTATVGTPVSLGSTPTRMVISSDGRFIDSVLTDRNLLRRFDTTTQTAGIQWRIGRDYSDLYAEDIAAVPGSPGSVLISRANSGISPHHKDIVRYDNGVLQISPDRAAGANFIEVNDTGTRLYGYFAEISSFDFVRWNIDGGAFTNRNIIHPISGFNVDFKYAGGRAYGSNGLIFNPDTGAKVGNFSNSGLDLTVPDPATGRLYTAQKNGTNVTLRAFDLTTMAPLGSLLVSDVDDRASAGQLTRWGSNGLAFRAGGQVFLVRTALVGDTIPTINSVTPNQGVWGTSVVIDGQNLLSTSSVKFNGLNATFRVDSNNQITTQVPTNATTGVITVTTLEGSVDSQTFNVSPYVPPMISVGDANLIEGNSGTSILSFPITLSTPAELPIAVSISTVNGSATASEDYITLSSTVNIPVGASTATAEILIKGDTTQEEDEVFSLNLSSPVNATLGVSHAEGTITNDDFPFLSIAGSSIVEGQRGWTTLDFTLSLSYASNQTVTFDYTTVDGSATAGTDYMASSGSGVINPGEMSKTISVSVHGDTLLEKDETFFLRLSNLKRAFSAHPLPRNEDNGHFYESVSANLSWDSARTAAEARTYLGTNGHLVTITSTVEQAFITSNFGGNTFWLGGIQTPGQGEPAGGYTWVTGEEFNYTNWNTGEPNNVGGNEDALQQNNFSNWNDTPRHSFASRYVVEYDTAFNVPGSAGQATGVISNDDDLDLPSLSINDVTAYEGRSFNSSVSFTVTLSKPWTSDVSVQFRTGGGTATPARDYLPIYEVLTFAPGETRKTIAISIINDGAVESDETFSGVISTPVNAILADGEGICTIVDADYGDPKIAVSTPAQSEVVLSTYFSNISGTASDNKEVAQVMLKLFRVRNNVRAYWNGSSFVATETSLPATLATPGATSTTWFYNIPPDLRAAFESGDYIIYAYARDAAGNVGAAPARTFDIADIEKPTNVISTPTQNQVFSPASLKFITGVVTDNVGVKQITIKLSRVRNGERTYWNGRSFESNERAVTVLSGVTRANTINWSYQISSDLKVALENGENGEYVISSMARDIGDNQAEAAERTFNVDLNPPAISISTPTQNQTVASATLNSITGIATDNFGVGQIAISLFRTRNGVRTYWNGSSFTATETVLPVVLDTPGAPNSTWSYAVTPALKAALDDGQYSIYAYGKDSVGNAGFAPGRTFNLILDNEKPFNAISMPTQFQSVSEPNFNVITGISSDNVGVAQVTIKLFRTRDGVRVYWNGSSFGTTETTLPVVLASPGAARTTWSYAVTPALKAALDNGQYLIYSYARDTVGNSGDALGRTFFVDSAVPVISISTPTNNQTVPSASFTGITGVASDNLGVGQVQIKLFRTRNGVRTYWNGSSFTTTETPLNAVMATPGATNTTWSYAVSASLRAALDNGQYLIYAYARDSAGNLGNALGRPFNVTVSGAKGASAARTSSGDSSSANDS